MKVAIVSTHPIQYHIPWYQALAKQNNTELTVYYALIPDAQQQGTGFGIPFTWDIPMVEGYKWELLKNTAKSPSLEGFFNSRTPSVFSMFANAKPDVVIITGWHAFSLIQALRACMRLRIPCIVRGESNALRKRKWHVRFLHRLLLCQYDAFLAIGKANKEFYQQYGIAQKRIFTCSYFVDNERFKKQRDHYYRERNKIRNQWNIPNGHTCFVFSGKLQQKKRIMDLLEALCVAKKIRKDIHLLVIGTGELMERAESFARERNLPVTFARFLNQTEVIRAYIAADCLVLPSDYGETWGLVVNEGMVCGLPAIVSDRVGCRPDLVKDGVTGYVFPFGDIKALANKLIEMASDADKRITMGCNAQKLIQEYSVEKAVEGTLQAIEFVCKKTG